VGEEVGTEDGEVEGITVGDAVGNVDGEAVGDDDGEAVGKMDGETVGKTDGTVVGKADGEDGFTVGTAVGLFVHRWHPTHVGIFIPTTAARDWQSMEFEPMYNAFNLVRDAKLGNGKLVKLSEVSINVVILE